MSNLGQLRGQRQPGIPTPPKGELIARYDTYLEAQRAVDFLSDNAFPVQFVTIVGTGLRMVERVTGRLTYGRVALAGAASGAWFGLFVGLLLSLFGSSFPSGAVFTAMIIGAGFGILFGLISYALTGGRRDFTSTSQIVATQYEVLCMPEQSGAARDLLHRLPGGTGRSAADAAAAGQPAGWGQAPGPWGPTPGAGGTPPARSGDPYAGSPYSTPAPGSYGGPPPVPPLSAEPAQPPVSGPTYTEMIEKQKAEREERERREREQETPTPPAGTG